MTEVDIDISNEKLVKQFLFFLMRELAIAPKKVGVVSCDLGEEGCVGMCLDSVEGENTYLILVDETDRNITQVFVTIAHEMVHVKQYMNENLGWFLDNRTDIPYHTRWWEIEAFEKSVELVKQFTRKVSEK